MISLEKKQGDDFEENEEKRGIEIVMNDLN